MWRLSRPDAAKILSDKGVRRSLARYLSVSQDLTPAKFIMAKKISAVIDKEATIEVLWREHTKLRNEFLELEEEVDQRKKNVDEIESPSKSYLDLKVEIAESILANCQLCSRRCQINRSKGDLGYCGCRRNIAVASVFPHLGEEPELVPSGTIFTAGCTMRCLHCQNWTISQSTEHSKEYPPRKLAGEVERLRRQSCRNANLVGGEPTPWLKHWLETFKYVKTNVPVVWNSNSYYSTETSQLLMSFADVYLLDFKYGPHECAEKISDAPDYWENCTRNHLTARKSGELIVRLLILPGHLECCTDPIMNWIAKELGTETRINIMFQYRPEWRAHEIPELRRRLTMDEMKRALELARKAGLTNFMT